MNTQPLAILRPVRIEVPRPVRGRPSYLWVDGYAVIAPSGAELQPYMQAHEAKAFCRRQGWRYTVQS